MILFFHLEIITQKIMQKPEPKKNLSLPNFNKALEQTTMVVLKLSASSVNTILTYM